MSREGTAGECSCVDNIASQMTDCHFPVPRVFEAFPFLKFVDFRRSEFKIEFELGIIMTPVIHVGGGGGVTV